MDLAAEQLTQHLSLLGDVESVLVRPALRGGRRGRAPGAFERAFGRFIQLPIELRAKPIQADFFHVADHSYAHLALLFPPERVGIYCHDIDAYRALLPGSNASAPRVLLSKLLLRGLRHARVVFHSTLAVREEILRHGLVPEAKLVRAPLGIAAEFLEPPAGPVATPPYLLHVGSCTPRKNIELLLRVFREARSRVPELQLLQIGGPWTEAQRAFIERFELSPYIRQRRGVSRAELAKAYAQAAVVLVPSLAEGFGLPVIEALACGAPVIASDIPVLREVGFEDARFCALDDPNAWCRAIEEQCASTQRPGSETWARIRARYTWEAHARTIADAYLRIGTGPRTPHI